MKKQLLEIANKKDKIYEQLKDTKNSVLIAMYRGFIRGDNLRDIQRKLLKISGFSKSLKINSYSLTRMVNRRLNTIDKPTKNDIFNVLMIGLGGYTFLQRGLYQEVNEIETKEKDKAIKDFVATSRNNKDIFYICSKHDDCALDHKDYQGKVYVDENWQSIIKDEDEIREVKRYIKEHNIKTFQWVVGKPVWLITRPNCRHFFKSYGVYEVLGINSLKNFINSNGLRFKIGDRTMAQTISHSVNKSWYKKQNVENIISQYQERLETHLALQEVGDCDLVRNAIKKDRFLIKKWKDYLHTL